MIFNVISAFATLATAIIAFRALGLVRRQISSNEVSSARAAATQIYNSQIQLALAYPKLSFPALSGGFAEIRVNLELLACYHWFMVSTLHACEEIVSVTNDDPQWEEAIYAMLQNHKDYLFYRRDLDKFYSAGLMSTVWRIVNSDGATDLSLKYSQPSFAEARNA